MANENLKKQMVIKLGTTTNNEAQLISNMVDGALNGKGGDSSDPELESLKKQMVIKLGTTTNEEASIISNMVDNAAGGGGGGNVDLTPFEMISHETFYNDEKITFTYDNDETAYKAQLSNDLRDFLIAVVTPDALGYRNQGILLLKIHADGFLIATIDFAEGNYDISYGDAWILEDIDHNVFLYIWEEKTTETKDFDVSLTGCSFRYSGSIK